MTPEGWSLRVVRAAHEPAARIFVRKHQFLAGAPVTFDEQHPHVSALEYALGALGADLVSGLVELARLERVELTHVEAVVSGRLGNPLVHLGVVGSEGDAGLQQIGVKVYASALDDDAAVHRLWAEVLRRSVLARTLERAVKLELVLKMV